jgi:site-specific DNA-cytosine methylase
MHIIPQIVSVRKHDVDVESLKHLIRKHKNDTILNISKKINRPKTEVEHWFRSDSSFAIPSPEIWMQLKNILNIETNVHDMAILEFEEKESVFEQSNRVYGVNGKNPTLLAGKKDNLVIQLNPSKESGGKQPYQHNRIYDINGISPCLDTDARSPAILQNRIRRLTPTECARLQSIPGWYKWNCSDTQVYKMCGNGWNVEVIKHILQHANLQTKPTTKETKLFYQIKEIY